MAMTGERRSLTPAFVLPVQNTELGVEKRNELVVIQFDTEPEMALVHPAGSAGAVTVSKLWFRV